METYEADRASASTGVTTLKLAQSASAISPPTDLKEAAECSAGVSNSAGEQGQLQLLPPLCDALKGRKTLVLDLDETLIHSSPQVIPNADLVVPVSFAVTLRSSLAKTNSLPI